LPLAGPTQLCRAAAYRASGTRAAVATACHAGRGQPVGEARMSALRESSSVPATVATPEPATEPDWYKDALIYQLHVKAFRDSNGDGIGDFAGLTESLDYIRDLGVDTVWLLPFYPSPLRDDGYDIADYHGVH